MSICWTWGRRRKLGAKRKMLFFREFIILYESKNELHIKLHSDEGGLIL